MTRSSEECDLARYNSSFYHMVVAMMYGLGGLIFGVIWGTVTIVLWTRFLLGRLDWPLFQCILFHGGIILSAFFLWAGCIECVRVVAQEKGLIVTTCYLVPFFVPWKDIVHIKVYDKPLGARPTWERDVQEQVVSIKRGLTIFHRGFPVYDGQRRQPLRGFIVRSDGEGYRELVRVIEQRLADREG